MLSLDESVGAGESGAALMADEDHPAIGKDGPAPLAWERGRPGRLHYADPTLLPLLRGEPAADLAFEGDADDGLACATGIGVSVVLSCLIWGMMGVVF
jgi:hypothetical protein